MSPDIADAPILIAAPEHIVFEDPVAAAGAAFTVILTAFEYRQPLAFVSVKIYVLVVVGLTVGFDIAGKPGPL